MTIHNHRRGAHRKKTAMLIAMLLLSAGCKDASKPKTEAARKHGSTPEIGTVPPAEKTSTDPGDSNATIEDERLPEIWDTDHKNTNFIREYGKEVGKLASVAIDVDQPDEIRCQSVDLIYEIGSEKSYRFLAKNILLNIGIDKQGSLRSVATSGAPCNRLLRRAGEKGIPAIISELVRMHEGKITPVKNLQLLNLLSSNTEIDELINLFDEASLSVSSSEEKRASRSISGYLYDRRTQTKKVAESD